MKKLILIAGILGVIVLGIIYSQGTHTGAKIRYGISPFQDTAMPKVAEGMDLYKAAGLNVELVTVPWEDIVPSLASAGKTIDVGIGSINLLLPKAENINVKGGGDVVFYYPLYVFKGAALLMHGDSTLTSLTDFIKRYPSDRTRAIKEATLQLKGKRIGLPQGTPYEQMLLSALKEAGLDPKKDVDIRYVKLADALPAFLAKDVDIVAAGVTQQTEAARHGHKVFMDQGTFGFGEIIGLVTTRKFADAHREELDKLIAIWYSSIDHLFKDVDGNSKYVLDYLAKNSSTKYSLDEYKQALSFQLFPKTKAEGQQLMLDSNGQFYWKRTWDIVNEYLLTRDDSAKISKPIPYEYYYFFK